MKNLIAILFLLIITVLSYPQIPRIISYQGVLTDISGNVKPDGNYDFMFTLYDSPAGGNALWTESKILNVSKGIFSTSLGDQTPFGAIVKFDKPYWLGIKVGNDPELPSRIALTSVGYSINSASAQDITDGKVVKSINGLKDDISITGSGGTTINTDNNIITISSSGGGGGSGIQGIQNTDNTLNIANPNGPTATVNLKTPLLLNNNGSDFTLRSVNNGTGGGISGETAYQYGYGIQGYNSAGGYGVYGNSPTGAGVVGISNSWVGTYGETSTWFGVHGKATGPNGKGVLGESAASYGVWGKSTDGAGVVGESENWVGVYGQGINQTGVWGKSTFGYGVYGESINDGIHGTSSGNANAGVKGENSTAGYGVSGVSATGTGVYASTNTSNGTGIFAVNSSIGSYGVIGGWTDPNPNYAVRFGVYGNPGNGSDDTRWVGIYGKANSSNQRAGLFDGNVDVLGNLGVGGSKFFKIDDPIDPANKYLYHSCVESPERLDVYNGNVVTDGNGSAVIKLPPYFEALNIDYRYQLTVIGQFAQAIIESEISNNQFTIKTDKPNVKVSWQVTGIRNDAYAKAHPMVVEEEKTTNERGKYLMPELFGQPKEMGINYIKPVSIETLTNKKENKNEIN